MGVVWSGGWLPYHTHFGSSGRGILASGVDGSGALHSLESHMAQSATLGHVSVYPLSFRAGAIGLLLSSQMCLHSVQRTRNREPKHIPQGRGEGRHL